MVHPKKMFEKTWGNIEMPKKKKGISVNQIGMLG